MTNNVNFIVQNDSEFQPCPVWVRVLCALYDLFFVISLLFIVGFIWVLSLNALENTVPQWLHSLYYSIWIILYYSFFWRKGQTPAMHIWRVHFMDENRGELDQQNKQQLLIRLLMGIIAPITWLCCFFNQHKKSLTDYVCQSRLVRKFRV